MNPEQNQNSSSENLTRRQKLLRRAVPLALLTAGVGAYIANEVQQDATSVQDIQIDNVEGVAKPGEAAITASVSGEFGKTESQWGHGTAQTLLGIALRSGAEKAFAQLDAMNAPENNEDTLNLSDEEIDKIVEELPTYDQASQILEDARYNEIIPDEGDKLLIQVKVTADTNKQVSYEVIDAQIKDIPNNQQ